MSKIKFKEFLLNENQAYLSQKIGDVLSALHELKDSKSLGSRDLTRFSERIVSQIRRILHSNWSKEDQKYLKALQKVGVAIMKSIEEKDNLAEIIAGSADLVEKLVSKLGMPINKLASTDDLREKDDKATDKSINNQSPPDQQAPEPSTIDRVGQGKPSNTPELGLGKPPLGGETQQLNAM